jgi:ankyrin repeat protein
MHADAREQSVCFSIFSEYNTCPTTRIRASQKSDFCLVSQEGMSSLMFAVKRGASTEVVRLLLDNKADATAANRVTHFCIHFAHSCKLV